MNIEQPATIDILDTSAPSLSTTTDMPVVETKPDASNEGAPPAAAEPETQVEEDAETTSESATEPGDEPPASDEPKKAKGVQKRLDELVRQREQADARAKAAEEREARILALLEEKSKAAPTEPAPAEVTAPQRPSREDFADIEAYEDAFIAYTDERAQWVAGEEIKAQREADKAQREAAEIEQAKQVVAEQFQARVSEYKAANPDYAETVESRADVTVPALVAAAITHSEHGPALLHHFGKNPEAASALYQLNPVQMLVAIGRLEERFTAAPTAPAPKPAPVSAAPRPITPIKPNGESNAKTDPESESPEVYASRRRKELGYGDPMARRH